VLVLIIVFVAFSAVLGTPNVKRYANYVSWMGSDACKGQPVANGSVVVPFCDTAPIYKKTDCTPTGVVIYKCQKCSFLGNGTYQGCNTLLQRVPFRTCTKVGSDSYIVTHCFTQ